MNFYQISLDSHNSKREMREIDWSRENGEYPIHMLVMYKILPGEYPRITSMRLPRRRTTANFVSHIKVSFLTDLKILSDVSAFSKGSGRAFLSKSSLL